MSQDAPVRQVDEGAAPTATLDEVDILPELDARPLSEPNPAREEKAVAELAGEMATNPRNMLQKLVDVALELCHADTAGVSLLEGDVFRWEAVAGVFASYRNGTMPRGASPCGTCIDRNSTQLMHLPDRFFPALRAEPRFVEALLIPFHQDRRPVGTVWIVAHNEDRKFSRQDERIMRSLAQFASAAWQLWKAREEADTANRRKDMVLAMVSHEIRTPVSAMLNAVQVLRHMDHRDAITHTVEVVERQAQHLTRLVDDLVDGARVRSGSLRIDKQPTTLQRVIAQAVEVSRAKVVERHHRLRVDVPRDVIELDGDPARLAQLFSNLIENAAKYNPVGGSIEIRAERDGPEAVVTVRDSGIGIPQDLLDQVFEPFVQLHEGRGLAQGGMGLGLTLVHRIAALHGGSVRATSEGSGKGSEFTVRLPLP